MWLFPLVANIMLITCIRIRDGHLTVFKPKSGDCMMSNDWSYDAFNIFLFITCYILPFLFNIVAYTAIITRLIQRSQNFCHGNIVIVSRACLICILFSTSWAPHTVFYIRYRYMGDTELYEHYFWIAQSFLYLNAIFDPPLYIFTKKLVQSIRRRLEVLQNFIRPQIGVSP